MPNDENDIILHTSKTQPSLHYSTLTFKELFINRLLITLVNEVAGFLNC